ncbi:MULTISPECIES: MipA/OmpV family protein [Sphingomonas]|uniref:Outer membrane scaffolding protein for murein synthesis, MipA/OmpV family n=1 Tax=Sphingomonas carotinifaciens TaxID=1166323 RepID=A0A1G7LGW7_9SPHN|nr:MULTISPECIES: MipA/OmpV family protein [Sphingomonas]MBB4085643.1 outer membrane scaffolding protein for murein synthesis (MipA/OmpV family) [Sphingomonas carotinifaciens]SDF48683.1 Outer membrane scaffolding protein for murein synthesis, MipA/OmpV family [Sphingomonas carotinifaciens]
MRSAAFRFLVPALALVAATPVAAQDASTPPDASRAPTGVDPEDFDRDTVTVAVAAALITDYEGSNDYQWTPAPGVLGSVGGYNFTVIGNRASIDLIPNRPGPNWDFQAGPIGVINFNRNNVDSIDDARVRALGEVKTAIELGGFVGIGKTGVITSPYDRLSVSLSYRHDVSNAHDSAIWQPTINYFTPLSTKAAVGLFASAEHAGAGYARTYFSIDPTQSVASTLPVYNARKGWKNWALGAMGTYSITGNLLKGWKVVGGVVYRDMLNDFADSPVVSIAGKRSQWIGALGIGYTF